MVTVTTVFSKSKSCKVWSLQPIWSNYSLLCVFTFQGSVSTLGKPICCFDPAGLIFAAGVESQVIQLYDIRAFNKVYYQSFPSFSMSFCTCSVSVAIMVTSLPIPFIVINLSLYRAPLLPLRHGSAGSVNGPESNSATTGNRFLFPATEEWSVSWTLLMDRCCTRFL